MTTFVYACSPVPGGGGGGDSGGGDGGGGDSAGGDKGDGGTTPASTTKKEEKRRKRSADLAESEKCQGVELDIITNEDNTPQETFNNVEKLESKIKSLGQELNYNNTMDNMELESAGGDMLKLIYKVDSECNAVRHVMLDALTKIEMIQMIATKCNCYPSFVLYKKDFKQN
ncbi:hypothetical protein ACH3XW_25860 [Acanthocheilonema viteae]|uniref:Uncharacterized protein n=1 Tax=Acanthocheilonema viteae TaxID=6277 RepID=A0A498SPP4_ACAVI|nr:unnamed protein product [Acanthocheilonema viteae]